MSDAHQPSSRAVLTAQTGPAKGQKISVHFNPVSLQYTASNTFKDDPNNADKQYVTKGAAKLTMDLIFDSTSNGQDVRFDTVKIKQLLEPAQQSQGGKKNTPSVVTFDWGTYHFQGMVESYKETLDFFSSSGVPLRASVNLGLVEQKAVFSKTASNDVSPNNAVDVPKSMSATAVATQAGNPNAGRSVAAANGMDTMRFSSGPVSVSASISLGPPVAFASGGAGIGIGAGAGIGIGAGAGIGISGGAGIGISGGAGVGISGGGGVGIGGGAGFGVGAGAGAGIGVTSGAGFGMGAGAGVSVGSGVGAVSGGGISIAAGGISVGASAAGVSGAVFGGSASAGVSASEGAFAGLRVNTQTTTYALDTTSFVRPAASVSLATDGDSFGLGGRISTQASTGLRTDVGATANLRARISFEGD